MFLENHAALILIYIPYWLYPVGDRMPEFVIIDDPVILILIDLCELLIAARDFLLTFFLIPSGLGAYFILHVEYYTL